MINSAHSEVTFHVTDGDSYYPSEEIFQARARIARARVLGAVKRFSLLACPLLFFAAFFVSLAVRTTTPVIITTAVGAVFGILLICLTNKKISTRIYIILEAPQDIVKASGCLDELKDAARRRLKEREARKEASNRDREESTEVRRRVVLKDITRVRDRWEASGQRLFRLLFACQTAVILSSGVSTLFPGSDWWNRALIAVPGFLTAFMAFGKFGEKSTVYNLGGAQLRYEIASHDLEVGDYSDLDSRARLDRLIGKFHGLQLEVQNGSPALPDVPSGSGEGTDRAGAQSAGSSSAPPTLGAGVPAS